MKKYFAVVIVLLILIETYGYIQNPAASKKLVADLQTDLPPIFIPTDATKQAFGSAVSSHGTSLVTWLTAGVSTNAATATTPDTTEATNSSPAAAATPAASPPAPSTAPPAAPSAIAVNPAPSPASAIAPNSMPPVSAVPSATPEQQAALAAWTAPGSIPSNAGWTWTTSKGVFHDVQIVRIEADAVTIIHQDGGALVAISELPTDLQKQLNYNPDAAAAAAAKRAADDLASQQALATERGQATSTASDYPGALAAAKTSGKLVMLHFTGSDWCPYCKMLDSEVLTTTAFGNFANPKYVYLTVDFPHNTPLPDQVKQQNQALAQKFGVTSYPTLVVIDSSEKEMGRVSGYDPGSGPNAVISQLKAFSH